MTAPVSVPSLQGQRTAVYRFYDADNNLLYVGITDDPIARWGWHRRHSNWWPLTERATMVWHGDRGTAAEEERAAIRGESPLHNIAGTEAHQGSGRPPIVLTPQQQKDLDSVVALHQSRQEVWAQYKKALAELISPDGDAVPISHMADQLGLQRKTVYRHLGRSMT